MATSLHQEPLEESIQKARRAFFLHGSIGAFQGDLSPLSTKSIIIETCVMPVLLYGCENWVVTEVHGVTSATSLFLFWTTSWV